MESNWSPSQRLITKLPDCRKVGGWPSVRIFALLTLGNRTIVATIENTWINDIRRQMTDERITASILWTLRSPFSANASRNSHVAYTGLLCSSGSFYRRILWREGVFEMILCFMSARKWHERSFSRPTFRPRFYNRLREHVSFSRPVYPEESFCCPPIKVR